MSAEINVCWTYTPFIPPLYCFSQQFRHPQESGAFHTRSQAPRPSTTTSGLYYLPLIATSLRRYCDDYCHYRGALSYSSRSRKAYQIVNASQYFPLHSDYLDAGIQNINNFSFYIEKKKKDKPRHRISSFKWARKQRSSRQLIRKSESLLSYDFIQHFLVHNSECVFEFSSE